MKLRKDISFGAIAFIGCLALGYGGTKYIKKDNLEIAHQEENIIPSVGEETTDTHKESESTDPIAKESQSTEVEIVTPLLPPNKPEIKDNKVKEKEATKSEAKDPLMNRGELESLIKNTSDNSLEGFGNEKTAEFININVIGMRADEPNRPTRVSGVREKLETGVWKSVRVISVESDPETGKITGATVEPIYD